MKIPLALFDKFFTSFLDQSFVALIAFVLGKIGEAHFQDIFLHISKEKMLEGATDGSSMTYKDEDRVLIKLSFEEFVK